MDKGFANPHAVYLPVDTPRERALKFLSGKNYVPWGQPK